MIPRRRISVRPFSRHADRKGGRVLRHDYRDLLVWRRAMELAATVYEASRALPVEERYGLTAQMRRAAISVPANIAEGQGRRTRGEFLNLLSVAHGSLRELETHVMLAERLAVLPPEAAQSILERAADVGLLVNGLAKSLKR